MMFDGVLSNSLRVSRAALMDRDNIWAEASFQKSSDLARR
jgi:hypothetical protein